MSRGGSTTNTIDSLTCVDASVVVKWIINEDGRDLALRLDDDVRSSGGAFVAPAWIVPETSSAIYKRVRLGMFALEDAAALIDNLEEIEIRKLLPPGLSRRAIEIAAEFELKWIYDAFYVALAEIVGCDLWTADEELYTAVRDTHSNVRLLADYPG